MSPTDIAQPPVHPAEIRHDASPDRELSVLARALPAGSRLGRHAHREAQLLFAPRGVMQVTTPRGRWLVPPERAVWLPPRLEHVVDVLSDLEMRTLYVGGSRVAAHPEFERLERELVVSVGPLLRETILAMFQDGAGRRRIELLAELALFELTEAGDSATFMPLPIDPRARRVAELVLMDPGRDRSLEAPSRIAGASPRTIIRLFPAETELTFKAWRRRARVMAGIAALGAGERSIKRVAADLGFSSTAAFAHAVRQVTGATPGAFLKRG